jgi:hypothetical protein
MALAKSEFHQQQGAAAEHCMHMIEPADDDLHPLPPCQIRRPSATASVVFVCTTVTIPISSPHLNGDDAGRTAKLLGMHVF